SVINGALSTAAGRGPYHAYGPWEAVWGRQLSTTPDPAWEIAQVKRQGHCWDNAGAESFFHTLKTELVYLEEFDTHEDAQTAVFEYIEVFYNRQRCHSA